MESLPRFVTLDTVMEIFAISRSQAYALVRSGDLPAIQVGGRGQWRVELSQVEASTQRQYQARETSPPPALDGDLDDQSDPEDLNPGAANA